MPSNRPGAVPRGERPGALPHQAKVILSGGMQVPHRYEPRAANWTLHYGDDSSSARLPRSGSDMARRSRRLMFQANQRDRQTSIRCHAANGRPNWRINQGSARSRNPLGVPLEYRPQEDSAPFRLHCVGRKASCAIASSTTACYASDPPLHATVPNERPKSAGRNVQRASPSGERWTSLTTQRGPCFT